MAPEKFADFDLSIKWTSELEDSARKDERLIESDFGVAEYRPFVPLLVNYNPLVIHRYYAQKSIFPTAAAGENLCINVYSVSSDKPLAALCASRVCDLGFLKQGNGGTFSLPRFRYSSSGERIDNITDWALKLVQSAYPKDGAPRKSRPITKDAVFQYVYAVLHDPVYREKYAINLKREFPRIPFYPDFWKWVAWGEKLITLHLGYEEIEPWPLKRLESPDKKARAGGVSPKVMLRPDRDNGSVQLDSETQLSGIPEEAWRYRLGNRSGIDWVLDQYKEKTPKSRTVRERFNTYRFADFKEEVIDLIARVTRVSIETVKITESMRAEPR